MKHRTHKLECVAILAAVTFSAHADEKAKTPAEPAAVNAHALKVMKRAEKFLADAKQFSVETEIWQELEDENGNVLQFSKNVALKLSRPNKLRVDVCRDIPKRSFYYNGETLTVQDHVSGFYGQVKAPNTTDAMIAKVDAAFNITFPLEDLMLSKPFGGAGAKAKSAQYLGSDNILGVNCHHVAFQNETISWQAWVDTGVQPLLRKVVIIFKEEEGDPRFIAIFKDWDLATPLGEHVFEFDKADGLVKIDVLSIELEDGEGNDKK